MYNTFNKIIKNAYDDATMLPYHASTVQYSAQCVHVKKQTQVLDIK